MSSQLKEKDTSVKREDLSLKREEKADFLFNQHIVRTVAYTGAGFGFGLLASLLFKHKAGMTLFFAGAGAGYGGANFINDLKIFRNNRNWLNQAQSQKQGNEELTKQLANKVSQTAKGVEETGKNLAREASQKADIKHK